jgi:serum/glucocorticoid-regulated kinase 2
MFALKALKKSSLILKKQLKYAIGEANILKKMFSPFILQLHYAFQTPHYLYLCLDYCPHGDLSEYLMKQ